MVLSIKNVTYRYTLHLYIERQVHFNLYADIGISSAYSSTELSKYYLKSQQQLESVYNDTDGVRKNIALVLNFRTKYLSRFINRSNCKR